MSPGAIDEWLYTAGLPDLDLIIRTSGEIRLSGARAFEGRRLSETFEKPGCGWTSESYRCFPDRRSMTQGSGRTDVLVRLPSGSPVIQWKSRGACVHVRAGRLSRKEPSPI
ncbi:hypothetical protein MPLB_1720003 [Mesorhizobium sp. ORS 3324]|nr:hypothetical protein MPLB_1720003 [Mesorhizobium sp. ORS 3324]